MGTRGVAQIAPTPATIALNAYIYGYGGHSLVTPHAALKQLWWTNERIEAKITRSYVVSKLRGEEREFLDRPLAFGEGLTDDTYMEWILERAKRLFLILAEVGVPDQIFGCIDDSWDDEDLPISLDSIPNLELSYENDDALNKRFYDTQFVYLLRELKPGSHVDYGPREHIPMEYVNTVPPAVSLQIWDRVHFPEKPDDIFMRRKYPLVDKETGQDLRRSFTKDVRRAKALRHQHLAPTWASYTTSDNAGYVISNFVGEHTLGTFIDHRTPMQFVRVPVAERPILLCEWVFCLADALAFLHDRKVPHTAIRPSNIIIDHDNRIAFADIGCLRTFQRGKKANKTEVYNYAAPEAQLSFPVATVSSSPPISSMGAFHKLRKMSSSTSSSSNSSTGSSTRTNSMCTVPASPITPCPTERSNSMTATPPSVPPTPTPKSPSGFRNFSRHITHASISTAREMSATISPRTKPRVLPRPTIPDPDSLCDLPSASAEMSDIFSLACIFLDILTFMLKGKLTEFVKFRAARITSPSPGVSNSSSSKRLRTDHSFHADPDKLDAWMTALQNDAERRADSPVFRTVPALLALVRKMLNQNATCRPSAQTVRDEIQHILLEQTAIPHCFCCANRKWDVDANILGDLVGENEDEEDAKEAASSATAGAEAEIQKAIDDPLSLATGISAPSSPAPASTRTVSQCLTPRTPRSKFTDHDAISVLTVEGRRCSSASAATAKVSPWRRVFTRLA